MPPAANMASLPTASHTFPSVPHALGSFTLSAQYLTTPHFQLDELESLLSSRFFSLEEGTEFMPTLVKNQQRDSISSSPGRASAPSANSYSHTHTRTTSLSGTSPGARNIPLQMSHQATGVESGVTGSAVSAMSVASYRQVSVSRDDGYPLSALAMRVRKESTGSIRSAVGIV